MALTDREMRDIIRAQRLDETLAAIAKFWRASGSERIERGLCAVAHVAEFRKFHLDPERRAFNAAVLANKQRKAA